LKYDKLILGIVVFILLGTFTSAVFEFLTSAAQTERFFYLILIGLPIAAVLFLMPRTTVVVLTLWIYVMVWMADTLEILPHQSIWLVDIILFVLAMKLLFHLPFCHHPSMFISKYILLLLIFAGFSAIANHIGPDAFIFGLRVGFRYVLLFLAIFHLEYSESGVRRFIKFLFIIGLVQTPVVLLQFYMANTRMFGDSFGGTFGYLNTSGLALFLMVLVTFLLARMMEESRIRMIYIIAIVWMAVCPIIGEVKFFFLFMPLFAAFMVRDKIFARPLVGIAGIGLGVMIFLGANFVILQTGGWLEGRDPLTYIQHLPDVFKEDYEQALEEQSMGTELIHGHRGFQYVNAADFAALSPKRFILGYGPGAITISERVLSNAATAAYFSRFELSSKNSLSLPWMLIEYGYIGTAAMLFLLVLIFRRGKVLRDSENIDHRVYGRWLEGTTVLFFVFLLYIPAWQSNSISFLYWAVAGLLVRLSYKKPAPAPEIQPEAQQEIVGFKQPAR
jgi:hypothetical protein